MKPDRTPESRWPEDRRLYRVFSWDGRSLDSQSGGALFVPRRWQGSGRHDNPKSYGALYCSLNPVSCLAEMLQPFQNQSLSQEDLCRLQGQMALVEYRLSASVYLIDLDDPLQLDSQGLRPSRIATRRREVTQRWASELYREGDIDGFLWWSTLEAEWINCTLFAERVMSQLEIIAPPHPISIDDPELISAAYHLGVHIDQ